MQNWRRFTAAVICATSWLSQGTGATPGIGVHHMDRDEYSYLENPDDSRATAWVSRQNERTLEDLEGDPRFRSYVEFARAAEASGREITGTWAGVSNSAGMSLDHDWVYQVRSDESHPRGVWRRTSQESFQAPQPQWETLLDFDQLGAHEHRNWQYLSVKFSPNGHHCLIALTEGMSPVFEWREFDLDSHHFVVNGFLVPASYMGIAVWVDDDTLLVAANFGPDTVTGKGLALQIRRWSRGQSLSHAHKVFQGEPTDIQVAVNSQPDGLGGRLITASRIRGNDSLKFVIDSQGHFKSMTLPPRGASGGVAYRGQYIFQTHDDWTIGGETWRAGSLLTMPLADLTGTNPRVRLILESQPDTTVLRYEVTQGGVLILGSRWGSSLLWRVQWHDGVPSTNVVSLPLYGAIDLALSEAQSDVAFATYESFLTPVTLYRIDVDSNRVSVCRASAAQFDSAPFLTQQLEARSSDGVMVPYFVTMAKSRHNNARSPVVIDAYGAFGASEGPHYSAALGRLWLERGGVHVVANIRGGMERGLGWHVTRTDRQHTYDDLIAVVEDLIRRGITSPKHVGIRGISAGGLLAGVMITRRPDLFGAAVLRVPVLDQLRVDLNGLDASQMAAEFGSLDVPAEKEFLRRTSPFQNLRPSDEFPIPLIITATNDRVVPPAQPRRFAAKMESLGLPFLYYESPEGGHNATATPEQAARMEALTYTYLAQTLLDPNPTTVARLRSGATADSTVK